MSRITALLATVALSALGLAGCGSEDVPEALSPQAAVAEAATKTADAGSARVTFTGTVSGVPGGPFTAVAGVEPRTARFAVQPTKPST